MGGQASQPLGRGLPGAWWLGRGLRGSLARQNPELLLLGKITKKTQRGQGSNCGKRVPQSPWAARSTGQRAFSGASDPQRGPGAKPPPYLFFKAKLSFYLDKLFKKCK